MTEEFTNDPGLFPDDELAPSDEPAVEETEPKAEDKDDEPGEAEKEVDSDAPETDTGDDAGTDEDATAESESESSPPAPEVTDETVIDLGEEKITVADLKEAYGIRDEAVERITEAKKRTEEINKVVEHLKANPFDSLTHIFSEVLGDKAKAKAHILGLAEKLVGEHIEFELKSDEEKKALTKAAEADELRKELATRRKADETREEQAKEVELTEKIAKDIKEGMAAVELTVSPRAVSDISAILLRASVAGVTVTPTQAAKMYQKEVAKRKQELLEDLDPDELPEKVRERLAAKNIKAVKKARSSKKTGKSKEKESEYKTLTQDEWDAI